MNLTKEQKSLLSSLKESQGWATLVALEKEALDNLGRLCLNGDLEDPKVLEVIKKNKVYAKARADFLHNTESHLQEIYTPQV